MIDLNNPVSLDTNANVNTEISSNTTAFIRNLNYPTLINPCLNGVVIYQTSLITNQPVPICVTSDMINSQFLTTWGQLFNIDFTVKSDSNKAIIMITIIITIKVMIIIITVLTEIVYLNLV